MKKLLALLLALTMVFTLVACGGNNGGDADKGGDNATTEFDYEAIEDNMTSDDGKYQIGFVTDVGSLKDKSFNQGTWEGVKRYATENDKAYKYYQPANGNEATDDDRYDAMKTAAESGAEIIVCAGFMQFTALEKAATEYPDVKFVFVDGWPTGIPNVLSIDFQEEQSGYLAGYAAVMDGYTKLGFTGGGGGENPACCRFGFGYVQGAQAAAAEKNVDVEVNYSWEYGAAFSPSPDLQAMLNGWYANGTEVIFCCGGNMCQSAFAAASANDGSVIGVDVDQSNMSETVITSATKGLREAVMFACDAFYSNKWDEIGGYKTLGAADNAVSLPTATWSLENFTVEQYNELFAKLADGTITVDREWANLETMDLPNVTLNII